MSLSRFVAIDDTNPSIQYSGPWFEVNDTQIDSDLDSESDSVTGIMGPPFQNTLHGVNVTANFSFLFSGSAVVVYGTSNTTNASGTQNPTWECFIDNTSIGSSPAAVDYENNWILCGADFIQFEDGLHLLTVKTNVSDQQTFWFDQIQYAPSANVSLDQLLMRIDSSDSAIQYGLGWQMDSEVINYSQISSTKTTRSNGSTLTYQFSGTSISMFGVEEVFIDIGGKASLANYTIDDQDPVSFVLPFTSFSPVRNRVYFETGQLSPGEHKLVVTFFGNLNTTPLAFNYFVQNASSSTSSNTPTSTSVPLSTSSNSLPNSSTTIHRKATEAIIGGVVGGVVGGLVLISLLLALFFYRRRNNRRSQAPKPFTASSSNPIYTLLPQKNTSNGQTLPSQSISSKFTQRGQPSDSTSTFQQQSSLTSPSFISPSSSSDVVSPFTVPPQNNTSKGQTLPYQSFSSKFTQRGQPSVSTSTLQQQSSLTSPSFISPSSSSEVVIPFTAPPQNNTSNGQTLPYQSISSKFTHRDQPSDPTSTSRIPPLSPLRQQFSPTSPLFISPSSSSFPLTVLQTNLDGPRTTVPQSEMESNEASGDRIPSAEDNVVELPPFYTLG